MGRKGEFIRDGHMAMKRTGKEGRKKIKVLGGWRTKNRK
jgi:hypothetical protein